MKKKELAAVMMAAEYMADIMRKTEPDVVYAYDNLYYFEVPDKNIPGIKKLAKAMNVPEMFKILSDIDKDEQKRVCGFMAPIFTFDGSDVYDGGEQMFELFVKLCGYQPMSLDDAIELWDEQDGIPIEVDIE